MSNYLIESMLNLNGKIDEARNPENDQANAIIRKWANSDKNRIPRRQKKILQKKGISLEKELPNNAGDKYLSGKRMMGQSPQIGIGLTKERVKSQNPDFDYVNWLNKERPDPENYMDNVLTNAENHAKKKNESLSLKEDFGGGYLTVDDLLYWFTDLWFDIEVYSVEQGDVIYSGKASDIPDEILEMDLGGIDMPDKNSTFTINVD